ncbi:MAG: sulfite exporter TauE/SafE family protein [Microbacteriaceae bacterium]
MDWFSLPLLIAGLVIGVLVGLTGMGGGALLTPILIFFFRIDPLTAVASDIVVSLLMKPSGAIVHLYRRTVNLRLVGWLCIGSVPGAIAGAVVVNALSGVDGFTTVLQRVLGVALLLAAAGLVVRAWMGMVQRRTPFGEGPAMPSAPAVRVRPLPTALLGLLAGFMVGVTSVGAGSIIIVVLLLLYPALKASQLVGTDLVQAVPLVAAAAVAHLFFGGVDLGVSGSLLIGAIPGAFVGAQISSLAPGGVIRRALAILLLASGLRLLGVPSPLVFAAALVALVAGNIAWILLRRRFSATRGSRARAPRDAGRPRDASEQRAGRS